MCVSTPPPPPPQIPGRSNPSIHNPILSTPAAQDFRGDSLPNAAEILFRKVKFWEKGDAPPVFHVDGVNFLFVRKNGLLFGATTRFNVSPSTTIELLNRMAKVFKDYCGVLSEVGDGRFHRQTRVCLYGMHE